MSNAPAISLHDAIHQAIAEGARPRDVRQKLRELGIRGWRYEYGSAQGTRETNRRLRQIVRDLFNRGLCGLGCGRARLGSSSLCEECLREKFGEDSE